MRDNFRIKRPHGQIRQSQLITTFGPGAMMDLPNHSVIIGGLEGWYPKDNEIVEPRLMDKLKPLFNGLSIKLYAPPRDQDDPAAPLTGVKVWQFPLWFITQDVERPEGQSSTRSRMLVHHRELTKGKFVDLDKKKRSVVPVRFVRACRAGHIGDIEWRVFVHRGPTECTRRMWMDERGTSGDLSEIFIRCECGQERNMFEAAHIQTKALGKCDGNRPWLGSYSKEECNELNRLLIRTASNAYFPQVLNVISLPDRDEAIKAAVDSVWEFLSEVEDIKTLRYERRKARVHDALNDFSDEAVFAEIMSRHQPVPSESKSVKGAEFEILAASQDQIGEDLPDGNFYARTLPRGQWDAPWMKPIQRVVLVHRLREVAALIGFTRFEASTPDINGEFDMGVRRAELARETSWLPAIENRGEGIFLQFREEDIKTWLARSNVQERGRYLDAGFKCWKDEHQGIKRDFPGLPYVMLHSFAHQLITAVSLECGYPASSIRERIYALPGIGYGILLYTGTTDAEGTLGGLIQVGRQIHWHVQNALRMGELCSNDPVCSQHNPKDAHEHRFLHGAACHGCLLIAETSCEQHNDFLDRALVVPTVQDQDVHYFPWPEE